MQKFKDSIKLIGINPFSFVPEKILAFVLKETGKEKGLIPNKAVINKPLTGKGKFQTACCFPSTGDHPLQQQQKNSSKC